MRGTIPFMAPEQVIDSCGVRESAEIYAMEATLYWLLTGEFVYDFEVRNEHNDEVKDHYLVILENKIIPIQQRDPSIPDSVAQVIEKALKRDPEKRFETAAEMARALRAAIG